MYEVIRRVEGDGDEAHGETSIDDDRPQWPLSEVIELRSEINWLRSRLERLEKLLGRGIGHPSDVRDETSQRR
jgi:hypothetical protein